MNFVDGDENETTCLDDIGCDTAVIGARLPFNATGTATSNYMKQDIADVFFFNRVLTATEVNVLYEQGYPNDVALGTLNDHRSVLTFNNINLINAIGYQNFQDNDTLYLKVLGQKFGNSTAITSGNDKNVDIYVKGLPVINQQLRSTSNSSSEVYLYSVRSNFDDGFVVNPSQFQNIIYEIRKQHFMTLEFIYRNLKRQQLPIQTSSDIYPHTIIKLGIYSCN